MLNSISGMEIRAFEQKSCPYDYQSQMEKEISFRIYTFGFFGSIGLVSRSVGSFYLHLTLEV